MQNTSALKTFAQQTRVKLMGLVRTKLRYVLSADTAELRGQAAQITKLNEEIRQKGEDGVVEEVAYTWFNRIMALRYMDANNYNIPMVVTPAEGQIRPELLQEALGGIVDDSLGLTSEEKLLPEDQLYRRLLVAVCNQMNESMPFLFEHISDYTELLLPDDLLTEQSFVTDIRNGMTDEDCKQLQIVGWLYQFYITDRKKEAEDNKSRKGGLRSDEQAAATQLFTPDWIVRYMVENTLGRIWMTLRPNSPLREKMKYYIDPADGNTEPIPEHIKSVKDISFIDPCMGSGHVLIYAFILFAQMYEEEGYRQKDIPKLIFENNLFGMDIDRRCYQLASFALTMTACRYLGRRYLRHTVAPNVVALQPVSHDVIDATGPWQKDSLMWQFEHIDTIGSLLKVTSEEYENIHIHDGVFGDPEKIMKKEAEYLSRKYDCVVTNPPYLGKGFDDYLKNYVNSIYPNSKSDLMASFMEQCMSLCQHNGKMSMINMQSWMFLSTFQSLRDFLLSSVQISSLLHLGPHTFDELSGEVVQNVAFVISNGESNTTGKYYRLIEGKNCSEKEQMFLRHISSNDNKEKVYYPNVKQEDFRKIPGSPIGYWVSKTIFSVFSENPALSDIAKPCVGLQTANNAVFVRYWAEINFNKIGLGLANKEQAKLSKLKWFPYNKGGGPRKWYGNQSYVVNWENDGKEIKANKGSAVRNPKFYFRPSLSWSLISSIGCTFRYFPQGFMFDVSGMSIFNVDKSLLGYLNTTLCTYMLNIINPTINYQVGDVSRLPVVNVPSELRKNICEYNIVISKLDWDAHETSWDFVENPLVAIIKSAKGWSDGKETVSRIVSEQSTDSVTPKHDDYQSEIESLRNLCSNDNGVHHHESTIEKSVEAFKTLWTARFMQLHDNEEELNREFIDIYGLQDELTPDVPLNEITILQQGEISIDDNKIVWHDEVLIKQLISYLVGCLMGRYSVDKSGLIIANQHQDLNALGLQVDGLDGSPKSSISIDDDGIIPIIEEESFFSDDMAQRVSQAIKFVFGEDAYIENMRYMEKTLGKSLREYLFKDFYNDHLQMYSVKGEKRPIYWMFSSRMGDKHKKGYFRALVYMHRMEADTLSQLHATYVAPYLRKAEIQLKEAESVTLRDDLTGPQRNKANRTVDELKDKVREVTEFEQKLVEMASHRTVFDLDDGVKANYPLFYPLVEPVKGLELPKKKKE